MAGGLIQLMSYGYEDKVLISNPEITFFKIVYYKYSFFSIQEHTLLSETDVNFGSSTIFKIKNYGDLVFRPILQVELPSIQVDYIDTIDNYVQEQLNISVPSNANMNLIMSKIDAISYNYNSIKFPVFLDNNLIINNMYDTINTLFTNTITTGLLDNIYNSFFNLDSLATNFQKVINTTSLGLIQNNQNIYYSTYNINYLTTVLTRILNNLDISNNLILTCNDFFLNFKNNLFNYITSSTENQFIYSILTNSSNANFNNKNIQTIITNKLYYNLQYYYSNINLLYIYSSKQSSSKQSSSKQLKSIFYITNYVYSDSNYNNDVSPFINLYDLLDQDISNNFTSYTPKQYYLSNGYGSNKQFKLSLINNIDISNNSYDISFNLADFGFTTSQDIDSNTLYMIFPEQSQNISDYLQLYFTDPTVFNGEYYNNNNLLLPLCVIKYNSSTNLFDKITLSNTIDNGDYLFLYKDIFIFNELSQKNQYIIINETIYDIVDISTSLVPPSSDISAYPHYYSENIIINNPIPIINNTVTINSQISYLLYSTNTSLTFIDNFSTTNIFTTQEFTSPYQILFNIPITDFSTNRLKQINTNNYIHNTTYNLDTYTNINYILDEINLLNLTPKLKNTIINTNLQNTLVDNTTAIINIFKTFLNDTIFFKSWNSFQYSSNNLVLTISPNFLTNYISNIFTKLNTINNYYNSLQNIITNSINQFIDNYEILFLNIIRYISNLGSNAIQLLYLLNNTKNLTAYVQLSSSSNIPTMNSNSLINIYFQLNSSYNNGDLMLYFQNKFNITINYNSNTTYYYIENIIFRYDSINSLINLIPYNYNANQQLYAFMHLLNNQYLDTIFLLSSTINIINVNTITSSYSINLVYNGSSKNNNNIYDLISNDNLYHFYLNNVYNIPNNLDKSIEIGYILYHYAYNLFITIKDQIIDISNNNFAEYNDLQLYSNLWNIQQTITKRNINGNNPLTLKDLTNQNSNTTYYIDCNISFSNSFDHISINNMLTTNINNYLNLYIRPKIIQIINSNTDFFNFFKISYNFKFINSNNLRIETLDINIDNMTFIELFLWYLHYLNSIISDINNYVINFQSNTIFLNQTLDQFNNIKTFFDESSNIFNPNYIGSNMNLSNSDYNLIININNLFNQVIEYVIILVQEQPITLADNTIVIYSVNNFSTIYSNLLFRTLSLDTILFKLPIYYATNFYNNYQYNELLTFFNDCKTSYLNQYNLLINAITVNGSYSNNVVLELSQYLNFSINNYVQQMNYPRYNPDYNPNLDVYNFTNLTGDNTIINSKIFQDYYKYTIINSPSNDILDSLIPSFSKLFLNILTNQNSIFYNNTNLLQILYQNINDLINSFNNFFNTNYSFYSDYRIILVLYKYLYKEYTFINNSINYNLFFDNTDNTSSNNYIINNNTSERYNYSHISFINNNTIFYTVKNNSLFDISNNVFINYDYIISSATNTASAFTYSYDEPYQIINNLIYDSSQNPLYEIINNLIYNLSNNLVGSITSYIYTINNLNYRYIISSTKQQILYKDYVPVPIINNIISIDNIDYSIINNIFYNSSNQLSYSFIIPDINSGLINFQVMDTSLNYFSLTPITIYSIIYNSITDLSSIFNKTFDLASFSNTIAFTQNNLLNNFIPKTKLIQLLNNIIKNSLLPSSSYNKDLFICASFNNFINSNNYTSSNLVQLSHILSWLINYNLTSINNIYIFNQTDQNFITINKFITSSLLNKTIFFVADRSTFIPMNSSLNIIHPNNNIDQFNYNNTSIFTFMLNQKHKLLNISNSIPNLYENLDIYNQDSKLIKAKIIDMIFMNISSNTISNFYDSNTFFTINSSSNVLIDNSLNNITPNSYYIRNSILVSSSDLDNINLSNAQYILNYSLNLFYLLDISSNISFLITTIDTDSTLFDYDISYNNLMLKFDNSNNTVLVNISDSLNYPKTLFIYDGIIHRINSLEFGYNIDISGNINYNFRYDLSSNILSRAISNFNYGLYQDYSKINYYIHENINILLLDSITFIDTSNNYFSSQDIINWDQQDQLVSETDIYIIIDLLQINSQIIPGYTLIQDSSSIYLFNIVTIMDTSTNKIIKMQSIDDFNYNALDNYSINLGIKPIIDYIGTDALDDKCVYYYWETFNQTITSITKLINKLDDTYYIDQKFTINDYINNFYNEFSTLPELFEIPDELFNKKSLYNLSNLSSKDIITSFMTSTSNIYKTYQKTSRTITNIINRDPIAKCAWIPFLGHYLINLVSFKIDDNVIEELDGQMIQVFNFFHSSSSRDRCLNTIIGNTADLTMMQSSIKGRTLYIPLPFFFESNEKALPLIALIYSQLSIALTVSNLNDLVMMPELCKIKLKSKLKIKLSSSYVFLDDAEKNKFAQMRHEYLIDIKKNYKYYINNNQDSLKLDLSSPVKDFIWFYLDNKMINQKNYWNYSGISLKYYDTDNPMLNDFNVNDDVRKYIQFLIYRHEQIQNIANIKNALPLVSYINQKNLNLNLLDSNDLTQLKQYLINRQQIINPFVNTELSFNGHMRFSIEGLLSGLVYGLTYYRDAGPGINLYNFARYPRSTAHSGSCNFKFANNINFNYQLKFLDHHNADGQINLIIRSHNVLRIASGIGSLTW